MPALDCVDVLASPTGNTALLNGLSAGSAQVAQFSTALPALARFTINPGASNQESFANPSSSAQSAISLTPAFAHAAGEPVRWELDSFLAHFGYFNPTTDTTSLVAGGSTNFFSPGNPNMGQPSTFAPGKVKRAFSVGFAGIRDRIWILGTQVVVARLQPENYCKDSRRVPWVEGRNMTLPSGTTTPGVTLATAGLTSDPAAALTVSSQPAMVLSGTNPASITSDASVTGLQYVNGAIVGNVQLAANAQSKLLIRLTATAPDGTTGDGIAYIEPRTACPLVVTPGSLPFAIQSVPYAPVTFAATGGTPPYTFTLENSPLPPGMTFVNGVLAGTPSLAGPYPFPLLVTDSATCLARATYTLDVSGPACASNATTQVQVTLGGLRRNLATGRWLQTVTLRNNGAPAINGPLALALDSLSANASLYNASGQTVCASPLGRPYVLVSAGSDDILSPAETATVTLEFVNTQASTPITYTPRVLAGGTQR